MTVLTIKQLAVLKAAAAASPGNSNPDLTGWTETEINEALDVVSDLLTTRGLDCDYEPNPLGLEIEALIDVLNAQLLR